METPNIPTLANLSYPKEFKKKQIKLDDLFSKWAEEDTKLIELVDELTEAEAKDAQSLKEAAITGKPDPGAPNSEALERATKSNAPSISKEKSRSSVGN
jgi:uncharacterized protein involved in exopolysaccharide biosynthesis